MGHPNYEYRPWCEARRLAASSQAKLRLAGIIVPKVNQRELIRANRAKLKDILSADLWTPANSANIIWPKREHKLKPIRISRERRVIIAYPYIVKPSDEHAELLAVNTLVPQMPGREDICQDIMLALWEKKITLDELKANRHRVREFVTAFRRKNMEASGYAVSLDVPMASGQSWHDVLAAPIAE